MKIEEKLHNLKAEYVGTNVPGFLVYDGWVNVRLKLDARSRNFPWAVFGLRLVMVGVVLALVSTVAAVSSQAASPGDFLYPVKVASQNVYLKISGDLQKPIESRTDDVINSIAGSDENLDEAIRHYENAITSSKNRIHSEQSKEQFRQILDKQEGRLRSLQGENSDEGVKKKIGELIEKTGEVRGEVRGEKDGEGENEHDNRDSDD